MQRRLEVLEKENTDLQKKNDKKIGSMMKERDIMTKEKADAQERCKDLQAQRQSLLDEVQKLEG